MKSIPSAAVSQAANLMIGSGLSTNSESRRKIEIQHAETMGRRN